MEWYHSGDIELDELLFALVELIAHVEIDEILCELPPDLQRAFKHDIENTFSLSRPVESIHIVTSSYGEHPRQGVIIARARRWLLQGDHAGGSANQ